MFWLTGAASWLEELVGQTLDEDQLCVCCAVMCAEISCLSFGVPIGYSSPLTLTDQVNCNLRVCLLVGLSGEMCLHLSVLSVCWLV